MWGTYVLDDLWADTESGHNIEKTVFIDCRSGYRSDGPEHLRPVGETEFVARVAAESAKRSGAATIAAIVSHANMRLAEGVEEVLAAHEEAGNGLFRGIRHAGPSDATGTLTNAGRGWPCPYGEADFRAGVRTLGTLGYTYDTWHFFHQNRDYLALAQAVPETTMILDHFGTSAGRRRLCRQAGGNLRAVAGRHRRHRRVPERSRQARRPRHARQRLRLGQARHARHL